MSGRDLYREGVAGDEPVGPDDEPRFELTDAGLTFLAAHPAPRDLPEPVR